MRFRQAQARLEVLLAELRFDWATRMATLEGVVTDRVQIGELVSLLGAFATKVELLAEAETKEWAAQFRAEIDAFDRNPSLKVRIREDSGTELESTRKKATTEIANQGTGQTGNAKRSEPQSEAAPQNLNVCSIVIRLAVEDPDLLDAGSLRMTVNEVPISVGADGHAEIPLEIGITHRIAAMGRATASGQTVRGELTLTPTVDDEGRVVGLTLR